MLKLRAQGFQSFQYSLASGAVLQMLLELSRAHSIEFPIEVAVNCGFGQFAVHETSFGAARGAPVKTCRKRSRARDSVDITVPIGIPVISPISL